MRESETTAERFSRVRREKGKKQSEMAALLGVSKNYVYLIESGNKNPSAKLVRKLDQIESGKLDSINNPSDPPPTVPSITFQTLDAGLSEMDDEWLIRQADYFYNDIMNADDCRTRLTHIGTLANMLKEMQDRLVLEWQGKRGHFPNAFSVLHKKKSHGLYLTDHPDQKVAEGKKARGVLPTDNKNDGGKE